MSSSSIFVYVSLPANPDNATWTYITCVQQNSSLIILFATHDLTAKKDLYMECCHLLDEAQFLAVFEDATKDDHSFLAIDMSQKDPNKVFSKDLQHWYQIKLKED